MYQSKKETKMSKKDAIDRVLIAVKLIFPDEFKEILKILILEVPSLID
jgi:hypothetical protein